MASPSSIGNLQVLTSISALRSSSAIGLPPVVLVLGTSTPLDGGQGFYAVNLVDKTTADNGTSVIVDSSGYRWELISADTGAQIMAALIASGSVTTAISNWLADPTAAKLSTAMGAPQVTGSGLLVFGTSPTLTTPALGTPTSGVLTNCTLYTTAAFTPTFTFATPGDLSNVYTVQDGTYWKIGALVHFRIRMAWTPTFTTSASTAQIAGLPFTAATSAGNTPCAGVVSNLTYGTNVDCVPRVGLGTQTINFSLKNVTGAFANASPTNFTSGVAYVAEIAGFYEAA